MQMVFASFDKDRRRSMTDYVLNHSVQRDVVLVYDGPHGLTERTIRVISVNDHQIRGLDGDCIKTFRRDRILAAGWVGIRSNRVSVTQMSLNL